MKKINFFVLTVFTLTYYLCEFVCAKSLTFVLDPGHGGPHTGCVYKYNGKTILEKCLNLKIAKYLKEELQKYKTEKNEAVSVHLTREDDKSSLSIIERIKFAKKKKAKALISLHINATGEPKNKSGGCMVLVTGSRYNNLYSKEHNLAKSIIKELNNIGVKTAKISNAKGKNMGILRKRATDGSKYPNGDTSDWFGIIRHGVENKILAILVEHAYINNEDDYKKFLSSDKKLKELAIADAKGIAEYYKLKK